MKRYSLIIVTILTLGMVMPFNPFTTSNYGGQGIIDDGFVENTSLAATPGCEATVIKVSDDAPVGESAPDTNYNGLALEVSNWTGNLGRSWLKFNLSHIPDNFHFTRATVNLFTWGAVGTTDYPIGIYYSENNTWTEESVTWNNQPVYNAIPIAVIDSPASPDMFDVGIWYEWEITAEVIQTIEQDGILSLAIRLVDEDTHSNTVLQFASRETSIVNNYNGIPFVSLEYAVPTTTDLLVDGFYFYESPQIDYINSANPEFSWIFNDADPNDFQKNYELEVWNNSNFDGTLLWHDNNSEVMVVHDTGGLGISTPDTWQVPSEVRVQYKWPSSMISQSGVVNKLFIEMDVLSGTTTYSDFAVYMVSVKDSSALTTDFQSNYDGRTPIQVLNRSEFTAITKDGYMVIDIENNFIVQSNLNLLIEFRHTGFSGTLVKSNFTISGGYRAAKVGSGAYYHSTADGADTLTYGLKLELVSHDVFSGGASENSIPFGLSLGESGRFQFKYNQSLINEEGFIDRILFPAGRTGSVTYENFSVYLVETPLEGALSHTDMDSNYAGMSPTLVLSADEYVIRDAGGVLVIDIDDLYFYSNTHNLLVELRFDSIVSGNQRALFANGGGAYRAFDSTSYTGNDTASYNMVLEFVSDGSPVEYTGSPLVNATTYYWRVRTYDSIGIWSPWESASFKYEVLESEPVWSNLVETLSPIELGESMTISIDVTHTSGIIQVLLEYVGINHTMSKSGDSFSHTWTPDSVGTPAYTVYMEPYSGLWTSVSDSIGIVDTTAPTWVPAPGDKVLVFGEALSYQLDATDLSGIASWAIDDTTNFEITDGLVTNKTVLAPGGYHLNVTVTDNEGNSRSSTFIVAVIESTTTTPTQPVPFDDSIWIMAAMGGVIVVLVIIIVVQKRKS